MGNKIHQLLLEEQQRIAHDLTLPGYVKNNIESIINCRTMNLGGHVHICPDMHGALFLYNSCKIRGCPVCMESEQLKWFYNQKQLLLPVTHNHLVFKVPCDLTTLWLYNRYQVQTMMFDAAKEAIKKVNKDHGLDRGWITVLHTWGSDLSYHPHLHILITDGGLDDNLTWQDKCVSLDTIRINYQNGMRKKLLKALRKYWLHLPPGIESEHVKKLIQTNEFQIRLAGQYKSGEGVLKYFSKKLKAGALNHNQVISYDSKTVTFYYKREGKKEIVKLKREEFIRRYLNHIPLKGFRKVRNYGLYSTIQQENTKRLKEIHFGEKVEKIEYTPPISKCPVCGKELTIVRKCSAKEFQELFPQNLNENSGRPPPGYREFRRFNN